MQMSSLQDMVAQASPIAKQTELMFAELLSMSPKLRATLSKSGDMKLVFSKVFNVEGGMDIFQQSISSAGQLDFEI